MNTELEKIYRRESIRQTGDEMRGTVIHEASHYAVAKVLGRRADFHVGSKSNGVCCSSDTNNALIRAATSWAGIIGEALFGPPTTIFDLPPFKPTSENLNVWISQLKFWQLSKTDRAGIELYDHYRAALLAYDILSGAKDTIEYLVEKYITDHATRIADGDGSNVDSELADFAERFHQRERERTAEKNAAELVQHGDEILASLPPFPIPTEFNFESFCENTGATVAEISAFVEHLTKQQGIQAGRSVGTIEIQIAQTFFREHGAENRSRWISSAKQFCAWREKQKEMSYEK